MEKNTPHCKLSRVHHLLKEGRYRATLSAVAGADRMNLNMLTVVAQLTTSDFYKSMTTHSDHTIWQDVYRPMTRAGGVYLKLTVIDDVLIVSFKEL